ncbi:ABC-type Co2+ transport system, permease component [Pseudorhodobacter antarcticus]|jgi:ABC-type Co2+ transport system permease subunit|uniref:ABC-type Co2+ transport system, permease component n=1 Tax=Pseudorhodobacter antarcticus TaxID=1077947 RepID=A0A1H8LMQ6_9RHOB|nr:energy-coupling factor ABC transporter permease [Pseudorhodobacter antarcticus]SEO06359.1 ABC-type Co2+ transport system, permease component [Pseudorhodobacter antarcticus]
MHIEPGIVTGAKILFSYGTAAAAATYSVKLIVDGLREKGLVSLAVRAVIATISVFVFFEIMPHFAVGVSEVHFILGSTLFLLLGAAPAAIGLALGLLIQGVFFAQIDLPQYGMNITTLLVPLFAIQAIASRTIAGSTAYVDLTYRQVLLLSTTYQGGVVAWVAFWAILGNGFAASNIASIATFGVAYMSVILLEPLVDLVVLALAKNLKGSAFVTPRLHNAA